ncbi:MAG: elongation factor G [Candidatus Omnitrophota bacterium]|nr:elongation factor G [Candidatus Omnitrophota bacterium]
MREDLTKKRSFILCGHAQSGKTSLSEGFLFKSGVVTRLGKVDDESSVSDYEDDEKDRKSSINLSVLHAEYKGNFLQFIDVPGYLDFIGELIASSRAADFAIIVVDATAGVEVGTEKAWDILRKENIPCLFFINKLDKANTNYDNILDDIKSLTKKAIPFSVFEEGVVKCVLKDKNSPYYGQIVEAVAESNDALLEKYLEKGTLDESEFVPVVKAAIINSLLFPVMCGVATQNVGIEDVLNFIVEDMPSVAVSCFRKGSKEGQEITIEPKIDAPAVAQVIKTIIDPFVGQLSIFKVFSGKISSNSEVCNTTKDSNEKIGTLYHLQGKQQLAQDAICAGEIGAVAKLKDTDTLDVLCDSAIKGIELPTLDFPSPAYSASVKPKTRHDEEKISTALSRLMAEDPTVKISRDAQTKELIIAGMGELHLHVIIERMRKKYDADVDLGKPKVPYLETITKSVKVQGRHKKQSGGRGQYGDCWIEVQPLERGKNFEFVNKVVGGAIPRNFIPSVEKGVRKAMATGILAGLAVTDIRVILYDGSYHPVDSSDIAFQIAATMAFKKALEEAGSVILEPIMRVEISVPGEFMGQVTGDINSKRGRILGMEVKGKNEVVKALVPLTEMFKYASDLRSVTGGRGSYMMSFSHYDIVPARLAQSIIEKANSDQKEE